MAGRYMWIELHNYSYYYLHKHKAWPLRASALASLTNPFPSSQLRFPLGNNNTCPCSRQLCSQQVEEHSAQCLAQNRHLMPLYVGLRWGAQRVNRPWPRIKVQSWCLSITKACLLPLWGSALGFVTAWLQQLSDHIHFLTTPAPELYPASGLFLLSAYILLPNHTLLPYHTLHPTLLPAFCLSTFPGLHPACWPHIADHTDGNWTVHYSLIAPSHLAISLPFWLHLPSWLHPASWWHCAPWLYSAPGNTELCTYNVLWLYSTPYHIVLSSSILLLTTLCPLPVPFSLIALCSLTTFSSLLYFSPWLHLLSDCTLLCCDYNLPPGYTLLLEYRSLRDDPLLCDCIQNSSLHCDLITLNL